MYDLENINRIRAKAGMPALYEVLADDIARLAAENGVDIEQALTHYTMSAVVEPQPDIGMTTETADPFADQTGGDGKTASEDDAS